MKTNKKTSRRSLLKAGVSTIAAAATITPETFAAYKAPGEVRIVFLGGDFYHNAVTQEKFRQFCLRLMSREINRIFKNYSMYYCGD